MNIATKGTKLALSLALTTMFFGSSILAADVNELLSKGVGGSGGFEALEIGSIIVTVFRLILAAAILWVVWNILKAGFKITGAGAEADKRAEGAKAIVNAIIGLFVVLFSYGIANTVKTQIVGNNKDYELDFCRGTRGEGNKQVVETGFYNEDRVCIGSESDQELTPFKDSGDEEDSTTP